MTSKKQRDPRPITKNDREEVRDQLISHAFAEELSQQWDMRGSFALKIYELALGKDLILAETAKPGWLPERTSLDITAGGQYAQLHFNGRAIDGCYYTGGYGCIKRESVRMRIPNKWIGAAAYQIKGGSELHSEYLTLVNDQKDLHSRVETQRTKIDNTLASFRTMTRVHTEWPEVVPFFNAVLVEGEPTAVAPRYDDLNSALGLPVETQEVV